MIEITSWPKGWEKKNWTLTSAHNGVVTYKHKTRGNDYRLVYELSSGHWFSIEAEKEDGSHAEIATLTRNLTTGEVSYE